MEQESKTMSKRQEAYKMLKEIEDEVFEIYKEVLEEKDYQEYYLLELVQKNEYLNSRLCKVLETFNQGLKEEQDKRKKKRIKMILYGVFSILTSILAPAGISIVVSTAYIIIAGRDIKKVLEQRKNESIEKEALELFQRIGSISTNIENNRTFITKKIKEASKSRVETSKKEPEKVNKVIAANSMIQDYLNYDRLPECVDEDIKNTAVNMLRQDLNSNNADLETLLREAKEKVSLDTLVKKMEFGEK